MKTPWGRVVTFPVDTDRTDERPRMTDEGTVTKERYVTVRVGIEWDLPADHVWADGEPESWTATDVVDMIKAEYSSTARFVDDWNLTNGTVSIFDSGSSTSADHEFQR